MSNALSVWLTIAWMNIVVESTTQSLSEKYFGPQDLSFLEIERNVSLVLVNSYFVLRNPRPRSVRVIEIGGMSIDSAKTLPRVSFLTFFS